MIDENEADSAVPVRQETGADPWSVEGADKNDRLGSVVFFRRSCPFRRAGRHRHEFRGALSTLLKGGSERCGGIVS